MSYEPQPIRAQQPISLCMDFVSIELVPDNLDISPHFQVCKISNKTFSDSARQTKLFRLRTNRQEEERKMQLLNMLNSARINGVQSFRFLTEILSGQ